MKAAVSDRYGGPEVVRIRDIPTPEPGEHEILVRVHATTVSRTDCGMRQAHPFFLRLAAGLLRPRRHVLGMDFAGTVERAGRAVTRFRPGDRVFGLSPERYGAHAEYLVLGEDDPLARLPEGVAFSQALVCEGAWYANSTISLLDPGQSILIYGASGAIGTAAVQLAGIRGLEVTAVVSTRHIELARRLGADHVIDYTREDFADTPRKFDAVLDAVGKSSYFACRHLLKKSGIFCATDLGPAWSNVFLGFLFSIIGSRRVSVPLPRNPRELVEAIRTHLEAGRFRAVIDRNRPLARIVDAYAYVETGHKTGIVVIDVVTQG